MKTMKATLVSAIMAISFAASAGNLENCCVTEEASFSLKETAELVQSDLLLDSGVNEIIKDMTRNAHNQVSENGLDLILQNMTREVRQRIAAPVSSETL